MTHFSRLLDTCDAIGHLAKELGLGLLEAEDDRLDGRTVRVQGRSMRNFCSCSYLGLELDPRLIEGAIDATRRFGTQFAVSRAFLSAPQYSELEALLAEITGGPTLVLPSTTLANAAALPALVDECDAVVLDQQVHMSVQSVMPTLERIGIHVERVRHDRLDELEARIGTLQAEYRRVWFLTDGVFSMHGDLAPLEGLRWLLERYPSLHLYIDDAHGMSWTGHRGRGQALEVLKNRDRVIVALSLNKAFGAGGAALVFPDEAMLSRVRHTSAPTNFTGPLQPPMLGAAVASARLHTTPELGRMQHDLLLRIEYANHRASDLGIPLLHRETPVPIRFIGLGPQSSSIAMAGHLRDCGLLASCALFPAVPPRESGIRFTVTRHHELEDIDALLETVADFLPEALAVGGVDRAEVDRVFGLKPAPI